MTRTFPFRPLRRAAVWATLAAAAAPPQHAPAQTTFAAARSLADEGRFAEAESSLRLLVASQPPSADAAFLLGYVLFREHKLTDALEAYTNAARLRAPSANDLRSVAAVYVLLKDYPDAERWLLEAIRLEPADAGTWYLLGRTQYSEDRAAQAVSSFERSLALRPRDSKAEYNLGLAYEGLQRNEEAITAYKTAIEWLRAADIRDTQPSLDLGILLLKMQRPLEALVPLQQAVEEGPSNPLTQQELGLALEANGRYTEAVGPLQRAAQLAPEADQPHFFLGRIYHHLGRKADAETQYAIVARLSATRSNKPTPNRDTPEAGP